MTHITIVEQIVLTIFTVLVFIALLEYYLQVTSITHITIVRQIVLTISTVVFIALLDYKLPYHTTPNKQDIEPEKILPCILV